MTEQVSELKNKIELAFADRSLLNESEIKDAIYSSLELLDKGKIRVCEKIEDEWKVNEWIKKSILLYFAINQNTLTTRKTSQGHELSSYDKVPLKFDSWNESDFKSAGFRAVAGSVVRYSAFIGTGVVLLPSFVNVGAYVDSATMVDTWATVGSCAQIGKRCHISGGAGIGGVLEPLQANPVIIEDDCFIGARSEIAEGVIVGKGSVISMGVYIGMSTKIIDRSTGEIFYGKIPEYSVVVPGNTSKDSNGLSLYCAVIVKRVDEKTRSKTSINELLRS